MSGSVIVYLLWVRQEKQKSQEQYMSKEGHQGRPNPSPHISRISQIENHLVYAWGRNQDGQLGLGTGKNVQEPKPIKTSVGYPLQISSAHSHTGMINTDGLLQMSGSELHEKLMLGLELTNVSKFHIQPSLQSVPIKQVACGAYHTLALAQSGQLFSWGGTLWGKTGQKTGRVNKVLVLSTRIVIQISCGDFHTIALTDKGQVYAWGGGGQNKNKGQLGHSNFKDTQTPEVITSLREEVIAKVGCGDYFSMALNSKGVLYSWGEGLYGQLGYGNEDVCTPRQVPFTPSIEDSRSQGDKIQQISLGGKHSLILTSNGSLYVCGFGSQGQLGLGVGKIQNKDSLTYSSAFKGIGITMVGAGSNHSILLTQDHNVYVCGYNNMGQLGVGDTRSRTVWTQVKPLAGKRVGKVYSGGCHSWALIERFGSIIQEYFPPTVLNYGAQTNYNVGDLSVISRSIPRSNSSYLPRCQESHDLKYPDRFFLQIMYTQVTLCHRFLKFTAKIQTKQFHSSVSEYLAYCCQIEQHHLKHYKLSVDEQLCNAGGHIIHPGTPRGYTIMMVIQSPPQELPLQGLVNDNAIGNCIRVSEKDLHNSRTEKNYRWFFKFNSLFDGLLEKVRIIELRPKSR